ncbi:MAG: hypothetical protein NVV73_01555 [Cellvibrionaceae bacterium]|nr:hypothetical protein [Cellvibrionaceae bacterium]
MVTETGRDLIADVDTRGAEEDVRTDQAAGHYRAASESAGAAPCTF